jgi:hypothetical protein
MSFVKFAALRSSRADTYAAYQDPHLPEKDRLEALNEYIDHTRGMERASPGLRALVGGGIGYGLGHLTDSRYKLNSGKHTRGARILYTGLGAGIGALTGAAKNKDIHEANQLHGMSRAERRKFMLRDAASTRRGDRERDRTMLYYAAMR